MLVWVPVFGNLGEVFVAVVEHGVTFLGELFEHGAHGADMLLVDVVVRRQAVKVGVLDQVVVEQQLLCQVLQRRVDGRLVDLVQV